MKRELEKYLDHPDRDRIIAHEMGWTWIEDALDQKTQSAPANADAISIEKGSLIGSGVAHAGAFTRGD